MNNDNNKKSWTEKYQQCPNNLREPDPFLVQNLHYLKSGSVLDVACGDGRNSVFLAKQGFAVVGVDFSPQALSRLQAFSSLSDVSIATRELDLSNVTSLAGLEVFDNVVIIRFKPTDEVFRELPNLLRPKGVLIICTFNYRQSEDEGMSREFCLEENELLGKFPGLDILVHQVFQDSSAFLDGYIFQKS